MQQSYEITPAILQAIASISTKLGESKAGSKDKPKPEIRQLNKLKSIYATLAFDNKPVSIADIKKLIQNGKVLLPKEIVQEVQNTIDVYNNISKIKADSKEAFYETHAILYKTVLEGGGKLRKGNALHIKGEIATHLNPPSHLVEFLLNDQFNSQSKSTDLPIIKSLLFFYEIHSILPFSAGNGRLNRLWLKVFLRQHYPVFEYIPFEYNLLNSHKEYFENLAKSGRLNNPTPFLEYMLVTLDEAICDYIQQHQKLKTREERINYLSAENIREFSRKDYMKIFKDISTATASRDLQEGVQIGVLQKIGDKRNTRYLKQI